MSLTQLERALMEKLARVYADFCIITREGETRTQDLREVAFHVHALQRMVMAQSAATEYPHLYRLMGDVVREFPPPDTDPKDARHATDGGHHRRSYADR